MTEKEKMLAGQLYRCMDDELCKDRLIAKQICYKFNSTNPDDWETAMELLKSLIVSSGTFFVETGFQCSYGYNLSLGDNFYANFGFTVLDANRITIGDNVMIGPGVHIYTAIHPIDATERISGIETAKPVYIGNNVWIGGKAVICPGVKIGNNTTIGAGSVVVKDIPDDVVAVGNPCKVIKRL